MYDTLGSDSFSKNLPEIFVKSIFMKIITHNEFHAFMVRNASLQNVPAYNYMRVVLSFLKPAFACHSLFDFSDGIPA